MQKLIDAGHIPPSAGYELAKISDDEASLMTLAEAVAAGELCGNAVANAVRAVIDGKPKSEAQRPRRERLSLQHAKGKLSLVSDQPITWDLFDKMIDDIRKVAKVHRSNGEGIDTLAAELQKS